MCAPGAKLNHYSTLFNHYVNRPSLSRSNTFKQRVSERRKIHSSYSVNYFFLRIVNLGGKVATRSPLMLQKVAAYTILATYNVKRVTVSDNQSQKWYTQEQDKNNTQEKYCTMFICWSPLAFFSFSSILAISFFRV